MMLQMFLLLLLSFFTFYLAQLCHLYCTRHWFPHSKAVALHPAIHRLLRPRSPLPSRQVWCHWPHLCAPGARSKVAEEHRSGYTQMASPALTTDAHISASPMLTFTLSLGMARMAMPSASKHSAASPAVLHSLPGAIPLYTA